MSRGPRAFDVQVTGRDGTRTVALAGELDLASAPRLEEAIQGLRSDRSVRRLVVDLGDLDFIDSTGLRGLLRLSGQARSDGRELVVVRAGPRVRRVFELTGLDRDFTLVDDPAQPVV